MAAFITETFTSDQRKSPKQKGYFYTGICTLKQYKNSKHT